MNKYTKEDVVNCITNICNRFNLYDDYNEIVKEIVYYLAHASVQNESGYKTVAMTNWSKAYRMLNQMSFSNDKPLTDEQYDNLSKLTNEIRQMMN